MTEEVGCGRVGCNPNTCIFINVLDGPCQEECVGCTAECCGFCILKRSHK